MQNLFSVNFKAITESKVGKILLNIKNKVCKDIFDINITLMKQIIDTITLSLTKLYNRAIDIGFIHWLLDTFNCLNRLLVLCILVFNLFW